MIVTKLNRPEDLIRIRRVANEAGYDIVSLRDAEQLWGLISTDFCASWLICDDDEYIRIKIQDFLENN